MSLDEMRPLMAFVAPAVAVYAGIRADLARLNAKADHAAHAADTAHRRIDDLTKGGSNHGKEAQHAQA